jgi:hypothetical protein
LAKEDEVVDCTIFDPVRRIEGTQLTDNHKYRVVNRSHLDLHVGPHDFLALLDAILFGFGLATRCNRFGFIIAEEMLLRLFCP